MIRASELQEIFDLMDRKEYALIDAKVQKSPSLLGAVDTYGTTILQYALYEDHLDYAQHLIDSGACAMISSVKQLETAVKLSPKALCLLHKNGLPIERVQIKRALTMNECSFDERLMLFEIYMGDQRLHSASAQWDPESIRWGASCHMFFESAFAQNGDLIDILREYKKRHSDLTKAQTAIIHRAALIYATELCAKEISGGKSNEDIKAALIAKGYEFLNFMGNEKLSSSIAFDSASLSTAKKAKIDTAEVLNQTMKSYGLDARSLIDIFEVYSKGIEPFDFCFNLDALHSFITGCINTTGSQSKPMIYMLSGLIKPELHDQKNLENRIYSIFFNGLNSPNEARLFRDHLMPNFEEQYMKEEIAEVIFVNHGSWNHMASISSHEMCLKSKSYYYPEVMTYKFHQGDFENSHENFWEAWIIGYDCRPASGMSSEDSFLEIANQAIIQGYEITNERVASRIPESVQAMFDARKLNQEIKGAESENVSAPFRRSRQL